MVTIDREPVIRVGLLTGAREVSFDLAGSFVCGDRAAMRAGSYTAHLERGTVKLEGAASMSAPSITLAPANIDECQFTVRGVTIGIGFHWEREESQKFQGKLIIIPEGDSLTVINELPIEAYLASVISSEMSASSPSELLRAHAIISRSWLLAPLIRTDATSAEKQQFVNVATADSDELIRWYGRESHSQFDVCADDHCQRYQGISKAFSQSAFDAVRDTRGKLLMYGEEICDTRYSKSCGGMTESYSSVWEDQDQPYLKPIYDGPGSEAPGHRMPLSVEANAEDWIVETPLAYCAMPNAELLAAILPGFDQETRDFYRWRVEYSQDELSEILQSRFGVDFGGIYSLVPLERGESGRIIRLKISGEKRTLAIGKELEIRRALSHSHLYSSAFVVQPQAGSGSKYPLRFTLIGAGWGHGVGLCQIGAAVMADRGHGHEEILAHYFQNTEVKKLY
ncbi:MAG TPA: SpoIID/LytB domain-containing protein [Blastocatellia bacterium]|nr:SpoIID/LytB domain-containing protein [Blastocatellia bacterium]